MVKKLLITALLLIVIGVVGCIFTFKSIIKTNEINEEKSIDYENIDAIQINTIATNVEIIASKDQTQASFHLQGKIKSSKKPQLSVKVEGTKLIVDLKEKSNNFWFQIGPNISSGTLKLKVYVPEKLLNTFAIDTVSGDLYIENIQTNTLTFSSISGDINGEKLQSENTTIESVSGEVEIKEITGKVNISSTSGDIELSMKDLIYPMQVESTSGDIEIQIENEPTDVAFQVNSVSGNIHIFDKYTGNATIGKGSILAKIETISGDISVDNY